MNRYSGYKLLVVIWYIFVFTTLSPAQQLSSSEWQKVQKVIVINSGVEVSAWDDKDHRADVCLQQYNVRVVSMVLVSDGTYEARFDLYPGMEYNFTFFAINSKDPLPGIVTGQRYYDAVPSFGTDNAFIVSTVPIQGGNFTNLNCAKFISINGDARRYIKIPEWLEPGTTLYVYCNWSSSPTVVRNLRARPRNSAVELSWEEPSGWWGIGGESNRVIDVLVGGEYVIMRSTSVDGPYSVVATTPGYCFSWTDTNVQNGVRYYYVIVVRDAYNTLLKLESDRSYEVAAMPNVPVNIRFRVENIEFKKEKKEIEGIVYLTSESEGNNDFGRYVIVGRVVSCSVKRKRFYLF